MSNDENIFEIYILFIFLSICIVIIVNFFEMVSDIHQIKEYIVSDDVYIEKVGEIDNE